MSARSKRPAVALRYHSKQKYQAVLNAGCILFLKNGYTETTMEDIAALADVSKQTVYSYFKTKDALFCQIVESECEKHSPPDTLLGKDLTLDEALTRIGSGYIDLIGSVHGISIHRLVITESARHPRIAKTFYEHGPLRIFELLYKYLERQRQSGAVKIEDTTAAAHYFLGMIKGPYHLRMQLRLKPHPRRQEIHEHVRHTVRMFKKMYGIK